MKRFMKSIISILFITLFMVISIIPLSSKIFRGGVIESQTWGEKDSPVIITSDIIVPKGVTLNILPGTVVRIQSPNGIYILGGTLVAKGLFRNKITFTSGETLAQPKDWNGIRLEYASPASVLLNCVIRHAYTAVTCIESDITIKQCIMVNNYRNAIHNRSSDTEIHKSFLIKNGQTGICNDKSNINVKESRMLHNKHSGVYNVNSPDVDVYGCYSMFNQFGVYDLNSDSDINFTNLKGNYIDGYRKIEGTEFK